MVCAPYFATTAFDLLTLLSQYVLILSIGDQNLYSVRAIFLTPSLLTHQFQTYPCRCSRRVVSIDECIDLGCASNVMRVLTNVTAPHTALGRDASKGPTHDRNLQTSKSLNLILA